MNVEVPNPVHGAAFQILYERTCPVDCTTRERQADIQRDLNGVAVWATAQAAEVREAYLWSIRKLTEMLENHLRMQEIQRPIPELVKTLPRPPK